MNDVWWCLFSFRGRIDRMPYLLGSILCLLVSAILEPIIRDAYLGDRTHWIGYELSLAMAKADLTVAAVTLWPSLALQVKRARSIGFPIWFLLVILAVTGMLMLLVPTLGMLAAVVVAAVHLFAPRDFARARFA
ncbi:DUF805 domain-containing protein [Antarcticirhabdus aurantiaca]|uniref:DUF805 domain-containing protein n=1 Tax=Antarcticirhabdus aurantiaca TaxID=2606717 RepID=A0ACD4NUN2_9HYPH|nr:DUF805 domain-containing protein [Antarcticirhabdus aurantiaca]WAJ30459.1 DUF805 domain-containing protein [Jeongeuplla avenae]